MMGNSGPGDRGRVLQFVTWKQRYGGPRRRFGGHPNYKDIGEGKTEGDGAEDKDQDLEDLGGQNSPTGGRKRTKIISERTNRGLCHELHPSPISKCPNHKNYIIGFLVTSSIH